MARTIELGSIELSKLQGYRWEVTPNGVVEVYVVTDDGYTRAPEGQKRLGVELTSTEKTALTRAFIKHRDAAADREQVEVA